MLKKEQKITPVPNQINPEDTSWIDKELFDCNFPDERLHKRFYKLIKQLWGKVGEPIPFACEDWANTKAAYRFFSNERMTEKEILSGHFQATQRRFLQCKELALIIHDTTEFSYKRAQPERIGIKKLIGCNKDMLGKPQFFTQCGILMHSSLVITPEGLPLGLSAIKFWTRKKFKGVSALKNPINPTRISIENKESYRWLENIESTNKLLNSPNRCIHIGDRESDIYELFCKAQSLGTHFLVRTCVDRLSGDGCHTVAKDMKAVKIKGLHTVEIADKKGNYIPIKFELKYRRIKILPPIGKQKKYPALNLTVLHAIERNPPKHREAIVWKLITDLLISNRQEAIEKLNWYSLRWKIETFHKILKSGCNAENSKLRAAERLSKLIAIFCILSWRIFWMTILNRCNKKILPTIAFTEFEIELLDNFFHNKNESKKKKWLTDYLIEVAKLGGYLARNSDPPPGNMIMWRGLTRLTDIQLGFNMALKIVGNLKLKISLTLKHLYDSPLAIRDRIY